jgi:hypothetical protein
MKKVKQKISITTFDLFYDSKLNVKRDLIEDIIPKLRTYIYF